jgi:precorrin-2 dehydrogenase/sirohydrochlorin ferrochelatase
VAPGAASVQVLSELARNGRRVVRLVAGPLSAADLQALREAGVVVEILLAAPAS